MTAIEKIDELIDELKIKDYECEDIKRKGMIDGLLLAKNIFKEVE